MDNGEKELDSLESMLENGPEQDSEIDFTGDGPVDSITNTPMDELKSSFSVENISSSLKKNFLKFLPNNTGDAIDEGLSVGSEILEEAEKGLNSVRNVGADLLSGLGNILPESIGNSFKRLGEWIRPESFDSSGSRELTDDEKAKQEINSLLGEEINKETKLQELADLESALTGKTQEELLSKIAVSAQESIGLKLSYDLKYQRRDLELSLKRTLTLVKMYDLMYSFTKLSSTQLEAIVKNTALPDFAKQTNMEMIKHTLMTKAIENGNSLFLKSNMLEDIKNNFKGLVTGKLSSIADFLGAPTDIINMMSESEFGTPASMLTSIVADTARDKITGKIMKPFLKGLMTNESPSEYYKLMEEFRSDPSKTIAKIKDNIDNDKWHSDISKSTLEFLEELLKVNDRVNTTELLNTSNLHNRTFLDEKTKYSVTNVIPLLLGKILQEVTAIRKGKKEVSEKDMLYFDYKKNKFMSKNKIKKDIMKEIKSTTKSTASNFDSTIVKDLVGDAKISKKQKIELFNKFNEYVMDGNSLSPFVMVEEFGKYLDDDTKLKKIVINNLKKSITAEAVKKGEHLNVKKNLEYYKKYNLSNFSNVLSKVADSGSYEVLKDLGLLSEDDYAYINNSKIKEFNIKYGKVNLRRNDKKELKELNTQNNLEQTNINTNNEKRINKNITTNKQNNIGSSTNNVTTVRTNNINAISEINKNINNTLNDFKNLSITISDKLVDTINNASDRITNAINKVTETLNNALTIFKTNILKRTEHRKIIINKLNNQKLKLENENNKFTVANNNIEKMQKLVSNGIPVTNSSIISRPLTVKLSNNELTKSLLAKLDNIGECCNRKDYTKITRTIELGSKTKNWLSGLLEKIITNFTTNIKLPQLGLPTKIKLPKFKLLESKVPEIEMPKLKLLPFKEEKSNKKEEKETSINKENKENKQSNKINENKKENKSNTLENVTKTGTKLFSNIFNKASKGIENITNTLNKNTENISNNKPNKNYLMGGLGNIATETKKQPKFGINDLSKKINLDSVTNGINDLTDFVTNNFISIKSKIQKKMQSLDIVIPKTLDEFKTSILGVFGNIKTGIKDMVPEISPELKQTFDSLKTGFENVVKDVNESITTTYKDFKTKLSENNKKRLEKVEKYIENTTTIAKNTFDKAKTYVDDPKKIKKDLEEIGTNAKKKYEEAKTKLNAYIEDPEKFKSDIDELSTTAKKAIRSKATDILGKENLEKAITVLDNVKNNIPTNKKELEIALNTVKKNIPKDKKELRKTLDNLEKNIKSKFKTTVNSTGDFIKNLEVEKAGEVAESAVNKINQLSNKLFDKTMINDNAKKDISAKMINVTKTLKSGADSVYSKTKNLFSNVNDVNDEFIKSTKTIDELIANKGMLKILKRELIKIDLPRTVQEAETTYKTLFTIIDPTGELWNKLMKNTPKLLEKLKDLHMAAIEDARKGILDKGLDTLETGVDKGVDFISRTRDKFLNMLPKPIRKKIEPLLKNRFTNLTGNITKRITKAGSASAKLMVNEFKNIGKEGLNLVYDPMTGTIHLPKLTDIAKFSKNALVGHTKALSNALKVFYPEVFGGATAVAKTALKTVWDMSGIKRNMTRSKALAKARFNPPIDRRLYKAWLNGELTGNQILDSLKTEEDKERWENFLTIVKPKGLTIPDILLKTGKSLKVVTKMESKGIKRLFPILGKLTWNTSKLATKAAWNFTGVGDLIKSKTALLKAKVKPPIKDKMLYNAWLNGEITANQVMDALPDDEKSSWENFLLKVSPKGIKLSDTLNMTGKAIMDRLEQTSDNTVLGNPIAKALKKIISLPGTIGKATVKTGIGMFKFGTNSIKNTHKFITDILDKQMFKKPPIYYLPDNMIEEAGDFIKEVLPDEINGVTKDKVLDLFFKKVGSRKINKLVKKHMERLITVLPKIDNSRYLKEAKNIVIETSSILTDYFNKKENAIKLKKEKKQKDLEDIYKSIGMTAPKHSLKEEVEEQEKLKKDITKELKKEPVTYLDLLFKWDLQQQIEFLFTIAMQKGFDTDIFNKLKDNVDYSNKDLINSLRKFTELFAAYKQNKLKSIEALKETADDIIINLIDVKEELLKIKTPKEIFNNVINKFTTTDKSKSKTKENNINIKQEKQETTESVTEQKQEENIETKVKANTNIDKILKTNKKQQKEEKEITKSLDIEKQELEKLDTIAKNIQTISKLDTTEEKAKKKKEENAYLDTNNDGVRDGSWKERLKELYGKTKSKAKNLVERIKSSKASDWFKKLLPFLPLIGGAIYEFFKHPLKLITGGIKLIGEGLWKVAKWLVPKLGSAILDGIKFLGKSIIKGLGSLLSHIPGLGHLSKLASDITKTTFKTVKKIVPKSIKKIATKTMEKITAHKVENAVEHKVEKGAIKSFLGHLKNIVLKKFGPEVAAKLLGKIASRFVPFLGWGLLAYDAAKVGYYMLHDHLPFKDAVSKQILGFDIFGNDKAESKQNDDSTPVKPEPTIKQKQQAEKIANNWLKKSPIIKDKIENKKITKSVDSKYHNVTKLKTVTPQIVKPYIAEHNLNMEKPEAKTTKKQISLPLTFKIEGKTLREIVKIYTVMYNDKNHIYYRDTDNIYWRLPLPKDDTKLDNHYNEETKDFYKALKYSVKSTDITYKKYAEFILNKPNNIKNDYDKYKYENYVLIKNKELLDYYNTKNNKDNDGIKTISKYNIKPINIPKEISKQDKSNKINNIKDNRNTNNNDFNKYALTNNPTHIVVNPNVKVVVDNNKSVGEINKLHTTFRESVNVQKSIDNRLNELVKLNKELIKNLGQQTTNANNNPNNNGYKHIPNNNVMNTPKAPVNLKTSVY